MQKSINFAGMKRSLNILLVSLLSFMVVFLSVGTTFMHCLRSGTVKMGVMEMMAKTDCCAKKGMGQKVTGKQPHACCHGGQPGKQWKSHCMEYQQVKLSPTLSVQKADFDTMPVFAGIQLGAWSLLPHPVVCSIQKVRYWNRNVPHSPPRTYLTLLNTLII